MITIRTSRQLRSKNYVRRILVKSYSNEVKPAAQETRDEHYEKQIKTFETLKNIQKKPRVKKPQRQPFMKSLFMGSFDVEVLTYPQLQKEELDSLQKIVEPIESLMNQNHMKDVKYFSDKRFRQNLSDYRAIGLQASQFMDGLECNYMESSMILEALSVHNLRESILFNEQLGVQTLVQYADQVLKTKYLYPIMKGEKTTAFCFMEEKVHDLVNITTKAEESVDKKSWIINGAKAWVVDAASADYLIVFALTSIKTTSEYSIREGNLTVFLVDKDFGGITCTKRNTDGLDVFDVKFENTRVPAENIIGEVNKGQNILKEIVTDFRLSCAIPAIAVTKKLLNNFTSFVINESTVDVKFYEADSVRERMAEMAINLYVTESMLYLTNGLVDMYENQDHELESAIVKIFASETAYNTSTTCIDLIGNSALENDHWCNRLHRECLNFLTLHETNQNMKTTVALLGLHHTGTMLEDLIKKNRNPFFNVTHNFIRNFTNARNFNDDPKLNLDLYAYLHPSCLPGSQALEYSVKRLEFATELLLSRYGLEVVNRHMDLRRLAETAVYIYGMVASLGRASRSYCIGLQHADFEILMANSFCQTAKDIVRDNVNEIAMGIPQTRDTYYAQIADRTTKFKEYFPKHPLSRNF